MQASRIKIPTDFSPGFFLTLALMVLILPLKWCLAIIAAALFHEISHGIAVLLCGGHVTGVRFGTAGITISADPLPDGKATICSLAGPVSGFLLLLLARWAPRLALCAAVQSVSNLLPLSVLDGGHALRHLLQLRLPYPKANKICTATEKIFLVFLAGIAIYAAFSLPFGILPLMAAGIMWMKVIGRNTSCKSRSQKVQ